MNFRFCQMNLSYKQICILLPILNSSNRLIMRNTRCWTLSIYPRCRFWKTGPTCCKSNQNQDESVQEPGVPEDVREALSAPRDTVAKRGQEEYRKRGTVREQVRGVECGQDQPLRDAQDRTGAKGKEEAQERGQTDDSQSAPETIVEFRQFKQKK